MDNLTHTLTGLSLSRAGLDRFHGRAPLLLMLSANVPDIDIAALTFGQLNYFAQHRGITHALAMVPVMALLPLAVVLAVSRSRQGWRSAYLLSILGVASHLLLDWTNAYGVRLLLPFSGRWLRADLNGLTDLWILAALLLAWVGPLLGRLVSSEIGAKPGSGRGPAIFALTFFALFDFGRFLLHERALAALNARVYDGAAPKLTGAFPSAVNPMRWIAWVNTDRAAIRYDVSLSSEFDPAGGARFYKPEPSTAIEAAKRTEAFRVMANFAQFPLWSQLPVDEPEGAVSVELRDERFPFVATAVVDRSGRVVESGFHY